MIEEIYKILRDCDEAKFVEEIIEIINDLAIIEHALIYGYARLNANEEGTQDYIYKKMYDKYKEKLNIIGFELYHNLCSNFRNLYNTGTATPQNRLKTLKGWIVEYGAYKVLEHRAKENLVKYTLNYYRNTIKTEAELNNVMMRIDTELLNDLKN